MDVIFTQKTNHLVNISGSLSLSGFSGIGIVFEKERKKGGGLKQSTSWGGGEGWGANLHSSHSYYKGRYLRLHLGAMFSIVYIC